MNRTRMSCALLALAGLLFCAITRAGERDLFALSLEELAHLEVNIATGTPKPLARAPASTTVITAAEIAASGARDIGDVLQAVPGLHVSNASFNYAPRYFIRGITSTYNPHTLVLINGIPMTSLFTGDRGERAAGVFGLPVRLIERIEVIRGPGSAVHGADAFAGVINVITRHPNQVESTEVSLAAGSFATTHAGVVSPFRMGQAHLLFSLQADGTDGHRREVGADLQTQFDDLMLGPPASLAPGPLNLGTRQLDARLDAAWSAVRLRLSWRDTQTETAQGINEALDPYGRFTGRRLTADLTWQRDNLAPDWDVEAQLSYYYNNFRNPRDIRLFPPGAFFGSFPDGVIGKPELFEENARTHVTALWRGWERHRLRMGAGFYWGDLYRTTDRNNYLFGGPVLLPRGGFADVSDSSEIFQPENQRTSHFVFVQDEWTLATDWELTWGLRHDRYSDVGSTTNPRLALVWQATPVLTTKLLYGEAFRAPAFFELYATNNPVALGNPALKPEKLRSGELAVSWTPAPAWNLDLTAYRLQIRDFIDFVNDAPATTFTAQNTGRLQGHGIEAELRHQWRDDLQLLASYGRQRMEDRETGHALGLAPRETATVRLQWEPATGWQLTPQLTHVGQRERQAGDGRPALTGYLTLDASLQYRLSETLTLGLTGRNLGDADVREPSRGPGPGMSGAALPGDLPQAGRSVLMEVRWRLP